MSTCFSFGYFTQRLKFSCSYVVCFRRGVSRACVRFRQTPPDSCFRQISAESSNDHNQSCRKNPFVIIVFVLPSLSLQKDHHFHDTCCAAQSCPWGGCGQVLSRKMTVCRCKVSRSSSGLLEISSLVCMARITHGQNSCSVYIAISVSNVFFICACHCACRW